MTGYEFADVVLVPFPFSDQSASKKRPAVVVSSGAYNRARPDVIVMAITSQTGGPLHADDVVIQDWKECGLLKPFTLKLVLATIEQRLVLRRLGQLQSADHAALRKALDNAIGR